MPRGRLLGALLLVAGLAPACTKDDGEAGEGPCADAVRDASQAVEVGDQVRLLDVALVRCPSLDELTGEMGRYPGIVGYSLPTFVELRCARVTDEAVRNSAACGTFAAPATTAPAAPAEQVFRSNTLDGRTIEIRADADTPFVGQYPAAVQQTVDTYLEAGCDGVIARRDFWAAQIDGSEIGDEASAYAQHAQQVADYVGCEYARITPPTTAATSSATAPTTAG